MIELHIHVATLHVLVRGEILGAHDRPARHIDLVQDRHELALGVSERVFADDFPHVVLVSAALADGGELGIGRELGHAELRTDAPGERVPHGFLDDDVDEVVGAPGLQRMAFPSWPPPESLPARGTPSMPDAWPPNIPQRAAREALVIAPLDTAQVHHRVHHRHFDILTLARLFGMAQRRQQADREVQPRSRVAYLRAGDERRPVRNPGGAHRAAHRLGDVLVGLELGVGSGRAETLDRAHDDARIELVNLLPGETEAVEHARAEVLHDDVHFFSRSTNTALPSVDFISR